MTNKNPIHRQYTSAVIYSFLLSNVAEFFIFHILYSNFINPKSLIYIAKVKAHIFCWFMLFFCVEFLFFYLSNCSLRSYAIPSLPTSFSKHSCFPNASFFNHIIIANYQVDNV